MTQLKLNEIDPPNYPGNLTLAGLPQELKPLLKPQKKVFEGNVGHIYFTDEAVEIQSGSVANRGIVKSTIPKTAFDICNPPDTTSHITFNANQLYDAIKGISLHSDSKIFITTDYTPEQPSELLDRKDSPKDKRLYVVHDGEAIGYANLLHPDDNTVDVPYIPTTNETNSVTKATVNTDNLCRALRGSKKYIQQHSATESLQIGTIDGKIIIHASDEDSHFQAEVGDVLTNNIHTSPYPLENLYSLTRSIYTGSSKSLSLSQYQHNNGNKQQSLLQISYQVETVDGCDNGTIEIYLKPALIDNSPIEKQYHPSNYTEPDNIFTITDSKSNLEPILNSINTVTKNVKAQPTENAKNANIEIQAVNSDNVLLIDAELKLQNYNNAKINRKAPVNINTATITQHFPVSKNAHQITISADEDKQLYKLEDIYRIATPTPTDSNVNEEPNIPTLHLPAEFELQTERLKDALNKANQTSSDIITIGANGGDPFLISNGNDKSFATIFNVHSQGDTTQTYNHQYTAKAASSMASLAEKVTLEFGQMHPIRLSLTADRANITYILAPTIHNQDKSQKYGLKNATKAVLSPEQATIIEEETQLENLPSKVVSVT